MNRFIRKLNLIAVSFAMMSPLFFSMNANAQQSLFDRRIPDQIEVYSNFVAKRRGDLLTVVIQEATDVENRDERSMDKTGTSATTGSLGYGLGGGLGTAAGDGTLNQAGSAQRAFSGDSEFRSARQFSDRFSVVVVDILPNGNLLVKGERDISLQGDSRRLKLTGIIRQLDLLPDNSIPSQLVANLRIQLEGKGAEDKFTRQGWLGRRVNRLWPF